jgi:clan AA aspartic protease (TIGR02281 family)
MPTFSYADGSKEVCSAHPTSAASHRCSRCSRATCVRCTAFVKGQPVCLTCEAGARKRPLGGLVARIAVLGLVVAGVAGVIVYSSKGKGTPRTVTGGAPAKKHQPEFPERETLEEELEREPCDRGRAASLAEGLLRIKEYRATIERANAFLARCGAFPRVQIAAYRAHTQLSEWDAAIDVTTKLLESDPRDTYYRAWRGMAYEQKGDLLPAAADYEQTIAIEPKMLGIPINLANVYERLARPCEAIFPLEQMVALHERLPGLDGVRTRIDGLYARPECEDMAGTGSATIPIFRKGEVITTKVKLNGTLRLPMVVDTGASRVAIGTKVARALKLPVETWPTVLTETAGGTRKAYVGTLSEIAVQGVRAERVEVWVMDDVDKVGGLLGQSFLSRFVVNIDQVKGVVQLTARTSKK